MDPALDPSLQEPWLPQHLGLSSACQAFAPPPCHGSHQLQKQLHHHPTAAQAAAEGLCQHLQDLTHSSGLTPAKKMNIRSRIIHVHRSTDPSSSSHGPPGSCGTALQSLLDKSVCFCGFAISALPRTTAEEEGVPTDRKKPAGWVREMSGISRKHLMNIQQEK